VKLDAERKAGAILASTVRDAAAGRPQKASHDVTLSDLGVTRKQSSRWQQLAAIPDTAWAGHGSRS